MARPGSWRSAVLLIGTHRLQAKASVRAGQADATRATWATFANQIRADLGLAKIALPSALKVL